LGLRRRLIVQEEGHLEPIDWQAEFRPLDDEATLYLVGLVNDLKLMSTSGRLNHEDSSLISVAAYQVMRLTAMSSAGYMLYSDIRDLSDRLLNDLDRICEHIRTTNPSSDYGLSLAAEEYRLHIKTMENDED
jgi:hypothetical protein